jgi:AsmA protein
MTIVLDDTTFTGSMTVPLDMAGRFMLKLTGDALDMNRYMAPPTEGEGDAAAGEAVAVEIPADLIRPLNARGDISIASVLMGGLELENVELGLNASNGRMRIHPISAGLYGGSYDGDVRLDVSGSTPVLSMDENVEGVDLAKLALAMFEQDNITGSIAGNFKLSGRGHDMAAVQRTLGGTMQMELLDGTYEGTDVWYELRRARAKLKNEEPPEAVLPARTKFSSIKASGVMKDGILHDELVAELPFMQLTGSGKVNIPDATIDYSLKARVYKKPEAMEGATPEEIEDFTKTVIPLKITGPIASPTVAPDVEALLKQKVEEKLKEELEDKLKDLFGK